MNHATINAHEPTGISRRSFIAAIATIVVTVAVPSRWSRVGEAKPIKLPGNVLLQFHPHYDGRAASLYGLRGCSAVQINTRVSWPVALRAAVIGYVFTLRHRPSMAAIHADGTYESFDWTLPRDYFHLRLKPHESPALI